MTDSDKCLKAICEADAAICNHPYTFPCTYIAQIVTLPVKKVRQIMRKLEENGYVIRNHYRNRIWLALFPIQDRVRRKDLEVCSGGG